MLFPGMLSNYSWASIPFFDSAYLKNRSLGIDWQWNLRWWLRTLKRTLPRRSVCEISRCNCAKRTKHQAVSTCLKNRSLVRILCKNVPLFSAASLGRSSPRLSPKQNTGTNPVQKSAFLNLTGYLHIIDAPLSSCTHTVRLMPCWTLFTCLNLPFTVSTSTTVRSRCILEMPMRNFATIRLHSILLLSKSPVVTRLRRRTVSRWKRLTCCRYVRQYCCSGQSQYALYCMPNTRSILLSTAATIPFVMARAPGSGFIVEVLGRSLWNKNPKESIASLAMPEPVKRNCKGPVCLCAS